jgi:hypothetical protein
MATKQRANDRYAAHWRRLGLLPGAPDCVIKAAHRHFIEIHHPDRGGSVETARQVNVAADEIRGQGAAPNEHVAAHYSGEPRHLLGLMANAERSLVERAGRALASELESHPRLVARVEWAVKNFGRPMTATAQPRPQEPPRPRPPRPAAPPKPATPGIPDGLVDRIDFGTLPWGSALTRDLRLTWTRNAPFSVEVDAPAPLVAEVKDSKALPGRFIVSLAVDWTSPELSHDATMRGYTFEGPVRLRWAGGGEATVRVRAILRYPAIVTASPDSLDLGTVRLGQHLRAASIILISSADAEVTIAPSAWLARVDGAGRVLDEPLRLATNKPVRVAFDVVWEPIREKGAASIAAGKPVRPTGRITLRWGEREIEVPVQMVVEVGG